MWETPAPMSSKTAAPKPPLSPGFVAIIVFKYLKAAAFVLVGVVALRIAQLPSHSEPMQIARLLQVRAERESIQRLAAFLANVTTGQVEAAGAASLFIACFFLAEGTLLTMRIWWATYFTIVLTALGLPIEIGEIAARPGRARGYALLAVNAAILVYVWSKRNEFRRVERAPESPAGG